MLKPEAATRLRHARFNQGLTLRALSRVSGLSVSTIVGIEQGRNPAPRGQNVYALAKALGLKPADLLEPEELEAAT